MKKNVLKKISALVFSASLLMSFTACGGREGNIIEKIDTTKTQIYVDAYNGGYGLDWLKSVKKDFEADNQEYQIMISEGKQSQDTINNIVKTKTGKTNIYITGGHDYVKELVDLDCLVDLTDVFESKASSSESLTIQQKMKYGANQKKYYSKSDGSGIYTFPYTSGFTGLVFDYDFFVENGWLEKATKAKDSTNLAAQGITYSEVDGELLFKSSTGKTNYEEDDVIMSAGKDGKYGTYDDGQPTTLSDFEVMLAKIRASGNYNPFVFSDKQPEYVNNILLSIFATYEGIDDYTLFYSYDGTYSRTKQVITNDNGYLTYNMDGLKKGAQFLHDYVVNSTNYATNVGTGLAFTEAQSNFVLSSFIASQKNKAGAMLCEGMWWESEAKAAFISAESRNSSLGYGKRDYRFIVYPNYDGQKGIDGNGKGTVYTTLEDAQIFIDKNATNESLIDACKLFIKYTCRDKYLVEATKSGLIRPYYFDIGETYDSLTPFIKNVYEMLNDSENITLCSTGNMLSGYNLTCYGIGSNICYKFDGLASSSFYSDPTLTVDAYITKNVNYFTTNWQSFKVKMQSVIG